MPTRLLRLQQRTFLIAYSQVLHLHEPAIRCLPLQRLSVAEPELKTEAILDLTLLRLRQIRPEVLVTRRQPIFQLSALCNPPPSRAQHQTAASGAVVPRHPQSVFPAASSNHFAPPGFASSQRFVPETPSGNSRRFLPPTVTQSASRSSRAPGTSGSSGTQRMQFGHGAQFG